MTQKIFHGSFSPDELASFLLIHFDRENIEARKISAQDKVVVQIRSKSYARSGGRTAIGVTLQSFEDGVVVELGQQQWLGVAASLGFSALAALKNPMNLLHRIDDIAQDIEYLSLEDEIWSTLQSIVHAIGSGFRLSAKFKRLPCGYCRTANLIGASNCIACGAPLGDMQPKTCRFCGYVMDQKIKKCPNCKKTI